MTDQRPPDDVPEDTVRDALTSTGDRPTPEFVAALRSELTDAAAGRTTAPVAPIEPPSRRRWPMFAAAAVVALVVAGVTVLALQDGDGEIATTPPTSEPTEPTTTPPTSTADHPTTAELLSEWVGVRLNGVGNGAVNGNYPWFVIESVDIETGAIIMSGDDGCNAWQSRGTIVDGRYDEEEGESTAQDCGPGGFTPVGPVRFVVREDGIDLEGDGIVYPFGPGPVVADAATIIDRRRFIETSAERPFPFSVSFGGANVVGFDGCGIFGATAEYTETSVRLSDVESQCSTSVTPVDGDMVEHIGSGTIRIRREGSTIVDDLVSDGEMFTRTTTEGLIGDWTVGWGSVTFEEGGLVRLGRCETTWDVASDSATLAPLGDCVTGLFPGDPQAEATLRALIDGPLVRRHIRSSDFDDQNASVLDSGTRGSLRMERIEEVPPDFTPRLFALTDIDGTRFPHDSLPSLLLSDSGSGQVARGTDACGEFSVTGTPTEGGIAVDTVNFGQPCAIDVRADVRFAPADATAIRIDGAELRATDAQGRTGRYVEVTALESALVSDLLDPTTGTGAWGVDNLALELTGPPGVGVARIGTCERAWTFGIDDEPSTTALGPLIVDGQPTPITGCATSDLGHDAAGLLTLLTGASNGDGAEIHLADDDTAYLVRYLQVIRLEAQAPPSLSALAEQLVDRIWVAVDGPWRTKSPTLRFDRLERAVDPSRIGVDIDTGCNNGGGTFALDGGNMVAIEITVEEAACDHEVAHLTDGTTLTVDDDVLTVTSTVGEDIATSYVAVDALRAVRSPDLSGGWLANGTPITITGTQVTAPEEAPVDVLTSTRGALAEEPFDAFLYGDGWILNGQAGFVQLS